MASAAYFADEAAIVACLMDIIQATRSPQTWQLPESEALACDSFSALLEASMHSAAVWTIFTGRPDAALVIQQLLLDDLRLSLRDKVKQTLSSFCKVLPTWVPSAPAAPAPADRDRPTKVTAAEFASYFWRVLSQVLPHTTGKQANSAQLFDASLAVFRSVGETSRDVLDLPGYLRHWGKLLLEHKHDEVCVRHGDILERPLTCARSSGATPWTTSSLGWPD